ncbi:MAG: hypothetical protein ABI782_13465 [Anaerolineaceae bacterium]
MTSLRPVPAAPTVEFRPWQPSFWALVATGAGVLGIGLGIALSVLWTRGPFGPYEYHLWKWEANTLLDNAFARVGIGPQPDDAEGLEALQRYFKLTSELRAQNVAETPDLNLIETLTSERAVYENDVERLIERYIDESITSAGLRQALPLFTEVKITWPPVDFELASPPRLLVRSPRSVIKRESDKLLKSGLTLRDIEKIEAEADSKESVSLVISIGGLAAYPAIVRDDRSFDSLLDTASHEWTHHYLAFFPLGEQWGKGGDAEALNETTANIAGREIANLIRQRHPISLPVGEDGQAPAAPAPTVDFGQEMHDLRVRVDALLKDGKVDEAETAMEDERLFLADHGVTIRKLNQAYFAFYGTYADTPASSNPIGPKIETVWQLTKDVGLFLRSMREVTSARDLDATISRLQAAGQ